MSGDAVWEQCSPSCLARVEFEIEISFSATQCFSCFNNLCTKYLCSQGNMFHHCSTFFVFSIELQSWSSINLLFDSPSRKCLASMLGANTPSNWAKFGSLLGLYFEMRWLANKNESYFGVPLSNVESIGGVYILHWSYQLCNMRTSYKYQEVVALSEESLLQYSKCKVFLRLEQHDASLQESTFTS